LKEQTRISRIFDQILSATVNIASILFAFATLSVCAEIILRDFFNNPTLWVVEVNDYILLYATFLGAAWVLKKEGHIKMELILDRLKPKFRAMANAIISIIGALALGLVAWYGIKVTLNFIQRGLVGSGPMQVPEAAIVVVVPVGSLLLLIQFLRRAYGSLEIWKNIT
jgi:C4-dicarboxylate transporter, DctQ subunit